MERTEGPKATPRRQWIAVSAIVGVLLLAVVQIGTATAHASGTPLIVASSKSLGTLKHPMGPLGDGAASTRLGGQEVWVFGDTLLPHKNNAHQHLITNSGAWSSPGNRYQMNQQLEQPSGDPLQMIPFTAEEAAYNQSTNNNPMNRYALWPQSIVQGPDGNGYIFFDITLVQGAWVFVPKGVGVAKLQPGSLVAQRLGTPLFPGNVADFGRGAMVDPDGYLYLYGCIKQQHTGCQVARAPVTQLTDSTAYAAWDGLQWNPDLTKGSPTMPGSGSAVSVAWNPHLNAYLDVYNWPHKNKMWAVTAPTPEGPWSTPVELFRGLPTSAPAWDYGLRQHPALSSPDGSQLALTYNHPASFNTGVQIVQVNLS